MLLSAVLRWWRGRGGVALRLAVALMISAAAPAAAAENPLPRNEDELVMAVRTAIAERDFGTMDRLINWEGATPVKRRIVSFQIRHGLGRPVRSISLDPFPENGLRALEAYGTVKANMPVTHELRVVYDEPAMEGFNIPPTAVFLVGREGEAFRIALVVRAEQDNDDD